jgi:hypothetical protein
MRSLTSPRRAKPLSDDELEQWRVLFRREAELLAAGRP